MFIDDNSIQNFQQLIQELKKYLEMQKEYGKLEIVEKLTIIFSTMIFITTLVALGMVVLFYLSFSLAYLLEPHVGGLLISYAIIAGFILILMVLVAIFRKKLIINPLANFLANLFLKKK